MLNQHVCALNLPRLKYLNLTVEWIAMKVWTGIHGPQMMNRTDSGDPLIFNRALSSGLVYDHKPKHRAPSVSADSWYF